MKGTSLSAAAPCDQEVENWLQVRGLKYTGCVNIAIHEIDTRKSRQNQARENALNADTLERYVQAMKNGDDFPPIVVYKRGDNYVIIDGNHRHEAAKKTGRSVLTAYIVHEASSEMIELLTAEANTKHGDATTMGWRTHQAIYLMNLGHSIDLVTTALGLSKNQVATAVRVQKIDQRAKRVKVTGWDDLSMTVKEHVGRLQDDYVFKTAAQLCAQTEWGGGQPFKDFMQKLRGLGTVAEQMQLLSVTATDRVKAIQAKKQMGRRKTIQNPKSRVLTALGMVMGINPLEVPRLFLTDEDRTELRDRVEKALNRLADIEESLSEPKENGRGAA